MDKLDTAELRYKEYKAYVPPKWAAFENAGNLGRKLRTGSFSQFLAAGSLSRVEHGAISQMTVGHDRDDDDDESDSSGGYAGSSASSAGGSPKKGADTPATAQANGASKSGGKKWKKRWTESMLAYVKQQDLKAQAKARTEELQRRLRTRQKRVQERREREVEAPALAAIAAKSSFVAQRVHNEAAALRHHHLLCAAVEADQSRNRESVELFYAEKQEKRRSAMDEHAKRIETINAEHQRALRERSDQIAREVQYHEQQAHQRREQLAEQRAETIMKEHEAALKKDSSIERQRQLAAEQRHERLVEMNETIARRVATSKAQLDANRRRFEAKLQEGFAKADERTLLIEVGRQRKVNMQLGEKALARAKAAREAERARMLADAKRMEDRRVAQLKAKGQHDVEVAEEWKSRNRHRERINQAILDAQWAERSSVLEKSIELHHRSPPRRETPEISQTLADLDEHLRRKAEVDANNERARLEAEARALEAQRRVAVRQNNESAGRHSAFVEAESHRAATRAQAEQRLHDFEARTEAAAEKRREHADKHLREFMKERDDELRARAHDKASRIAKSLDLVNVQKHNELVKELREKEKSAAEKHAVSEAARVAQLEKDRQEDEEKRRRMTAMIEAEARRRERMSASQLATHYEKMQEAQAHRDRHLDSVRHRLQSEYRERVALTHAAATQREQQFLQGREALAKKERAEAEARAAAEAQAAQERRAMSMQRARSIEEHQDRAVQQRVEKALRTVEKLERAYSVGPGSKVHPFTDSFGSFSAERARSAFA